MNRWKLIFLLLVLAAGLAIGAGVSMLHNGLSARATPTAMEAMLARTYKKPGHLFRKSGIFFLNNGAPSFYANHAG